MTPICNCWSMEITSVKPRPSSNTRAWAFKRSTRQTAKTTFSWTFRLKRILNLASSPSASTKMVKWWIPIHTPCSKGKKMPRRSKVLMHPMWSIWSLPIVLPMEMKQTMWCLVWRKKRSTAVLKAAGMAVISGALSIIWIISLPWVLQRSGPHPCWKMIWKPIPIMVILSPTIIRWIPASAL